MDTTIAPEIFFTWDVDNEAQAQETSNEDFTLDLNFFDEKEQEDSLWQARTGLNPESLCGAIETIIFMSDKPISIQKIRGQIDEELPLRVIHEALNKLQTGYEEKHHGIRLVEIADGYQFRTKATYYKFVQNLFKVNSLVLTPTAIEVLAIIAYKQPVSKTEIEKIRGVDSSHIVRALMDKRLVKICGRSEELGRPTLFATTEEFLEVFNLKNTSELPPEHELEELAMTRTVANIADIKSVVSMGDKKKFDFDEIEELDQLSKSIQDISSDTNFTMLLKSEDKKRLDGEGAVKKSAFDILEDFVNIDETVKQNQVSAASETIMNVVEAKVVDIETDELLNAPVVDVEWEKEQGDMLAAEAEEFSRALDDAFNKLTGETSLDQDEMSDEGFEEELKNLDLTVDEAIMQGKEFDLDLSFLNKELDS